jgi:hypothetical protein
MSIFDIFRTLAGIFLKIDFRCVGGGCLAFMGFNCRGRLGFFLLKKAFKVIAAPPATRSCSKALAQLAWPAWLFNSDKVDYFSPCYVKAEAYWVVRFHEPLPFLRVEIEKALENVSFIDLA